MSVMAVFISWDVRSDDGQHYLVQLCCSLDALVASANMRDAKLLRASAGSITAIIRLQILDSYSPCSEAKRPQPCCYFGSACQEVSRRCIMVEHFEVLRKV